MTQSSDPRHVRHVVGLGLVATVQHPISDKAAFLCMLCVGAALTMGNVSIQATQFVLVSHSVA